jgi:hypothetical protein
VCWPLTRKLLAPTSFLTVLTGHGKTASKVIERAVTLLRSGGGEGVHRCSSCNYWFWLYAHSYRHKPIEWFEVNPFPQADFGSISQHESNYQKSLKLLSQGLIMLLHLQAAANPVLVTCISDNRFDRTSWLRG